LNFSRAVFRYSFPENNQFIVYCRNESNGAERKLFLSADLFAEFEKWFKTFDNEDFFKLIEENQISMLQTGMSLIEKQQFK